MTILLAPQRSVRPTLLAKSPPVITFTDYLYAANMARATVLDFDRAVGQANRYLRPHWTLEDVPGPVLTAFIATLPHTYASRRRFQLAITHYWAYVGREDPPIGAIPVPRTPKGRCRALPEDDARRLAAVAKAWSSGPEGLAVLLGLYMALRRFEIAKLARDDVNFRAGEMTILGKGHSLAALPIHPVLLPYLQERFSQTAPSRWLFPGRWGDSPVCVATINTWITRVCDVAGVECTTHQLRHTCLAELNDRTGDLRATSEYARHQRIATTMIYTRTTRRRLVELQGVLDY